MTTLAAKIAQASIKVGALQPDKKNTQQNYDYISADKMLERAGDALAEAGVVVFPSVTSEEATCVEYTDNYGKVKSRYDCMVRFAMIVSDGETQIELPWAGRGSDYAVPDKAFYKAITSGHKYFLAKLLNVGVGNEDGEHETAQDAPQRVQAQRTSNPTTTPAKTPQRAPVPASEDVEFMSGNDDLDKLHKHFHALGRELYGAQWNDVRARNVKRVSGGRTESSTELTADEVQMLVNGMNELKQKRQAA